MTRYMQQRQEVRIVDLVIRSAKQDRIGGEIECSSSSILTSQWRPAPTDILLVYYCLFRPWLPAAQPVLHSFITLMGFVYMVGNQQTASQPAKPAKLSNFQYNLGRSKKQTCQTIRFEQRSIILPIIYLWRTEGRGKGVRDIDPLFDEDTYIPIVLIDS